MSLRFLKYINPYHYFAILLTWMDNKQRRSNINADINEAKRLNQQTGAKVLVFQNKDSVVVVKKNRLSGKAKHRLKGKALFTSGNRRSIIEPRDNQASGVPLV